MRRSSSSSTRRPSVPWDSDRLEPLTQWTHPKTLTYTHCFLFYSALLICSKARANTYARCCSALLQLSAWGLCLFGTSLSLPGSITQGLHNVPYHFHPIHPSDFQALHLGTHHTARLLPTRILCKTTCEKKGFKYEFCVQCACDEGRLAGVLFVLWSWALKSTDGIDGNCASIFILHHYVVKNLWTRIVPSSCPFLPADMLPVFVVLWTHLNSNL